MQTPTTTTEEETYEVTIYDRGVVVGIDAAVDISRHFAVVPQLRMVAAYGSWNVRPAVALRWRP